MFHTQIENFGTLTVNWIQAIGKFVRFLQLSFTKIFFPPLRFKLLVQQMEFVGNKSLGVIFMAGIMVGGIFGLQLGDIFGIFGAESMIGAAAAFILSTQLAPVVGAMLVTGRAGSAMAAEIATMRVNEQIDAMRVMAVNPYGYLNSPRIAATMMMLPILTTVFVIAGVASSFLIGVQFFDVDVGVFFEKIKWIVEPKDVIFGLQKSIVFGFLLSSIGCYKGFHASGGAKGVGIATTETVVMSMLSILISNFFLSYMQFKFSN